MGHKTLKTMEMGSRKQQHQFRPTQTSRSGCINMRLPIYMLLVFVLSSMSMDVLGSDDGLFTSSSRIILPSSGTVLFSDAGGFISVLTDCFAELHHKYELLSWTDIRQFQSICGRHDQGISTTRTTRTAGLWIIILLFLPGNIHPNPGPELIELPSYNNLKIVMACVLSMSTCAA